MTDWPLLAILVITYNRLPLLRGTLQHLHEHLDYVGEKLWVVADDGSDDGTPQTLAEEFPAVQVVRSNRVGLGANGNAGLRFALSRAEYVLQMQDDMHLLSHLDLHPHVEKLRADPTCGYIRLWGVAGHKYQGQLEGQYWRIWWHSPELYIPSDRPHLKHRRFHEWYGLYPEGLKTAETEEAWAHQCKDRAGLNGKRLDVFVPQGETEKNWEHMGWHDRARDHGL